MKEILYWFFAVLVVMPVTTSTAQVHSGLVAVSADEKVITADVSSQAARCAYYLIFDDKGNFLDVAENPFTSIKGGAGISAANFLAGKAVAVVVAEGFGDKMSNALKSNGIKFIEFKGKADDAVKEVLDIK